MAFNFSSRFFSFFRYQEKGFPGMYAVTSTQSKCVFAAIGQGISIVFSSL